MVKFVIEFSLTDYFHLKPPNINRMRIRNSKSVFLMPKAMRAFINKDKRNRFVPIWVIEALIPSYTSPQWVELFSEGTFPFFIRLKKYHYKIIFYPLLDKKALHSECFLIFCFSIRLQWFGYHLFFVTQNLWKLK